MNTILHRFLLCVPLALCPAWARAATLDLPERPGTFWSQPDGLSVPAATPTGVVRFASLAALTDHALRDEPAYREGLPLRKADWTAYLEWASRAFRISASGVSDATQIHTHMCYSEFNDILPAIAAMDADVITIETSRSDMELLRGFGEFSYPNEIGPGVYDIHSPRIPDAADMTRLLEKAAQVIAPDRLWVNPDCGLKTRGWAETETALANMVAAARTMRESLQSAIQ